MILFRILPRSRIHHLKDESAGQKAPFAAIPHFTSGSGRGAAAKGAKFVASKE